MVRNGNHDMKMTEYGDMKGETDGCDCVWRKSVRSYAC